MFKRKLIKQSKFKRLILKLLNVYAFEKETFNIINPNFNLEGLDLFKFNEKSFSLSRGYTKLDRKIKGLDIYFRYSPYNNLWNSTQRWKRIIPNIDKKTLISVCLLSLKNSILNFCKDEDIKISIHLISDNSSNEFDQKIMNLVKSDNFKSYLYKSKIEGNRGSYLECCDQAEKAEDLIFFVEDDYLFENVCIDEMLSTYSRVSSLIKDDIILCPSDYPFYYDTLYSTSIHIGKNYKWRNVGESLLTLLFSKNIYKNYSTQIKEVGREINDPFEKPLHSIYKKINCLAPIGSLSYHISRSVPSNNEDWMSVWKKNLNDLNTLSLSSNNS